MADTGKPFVSQKLTADKLEFWILLVIKSILLIKLAILEIYQ